MLFRNIEKGSESKEEERLMEESIGGPWDKNYSEQLDDQGEPIEEEELDLVNPFKDLDEKTLERMRLETEEERRKNEEKLAA
ncbi:MAG: hypothetical protein WCX17_00610 [Parcubacteria group bacterium]|jgi:hypothetical protein